MSHPAADRNLLPGILALQMDFVDRDQLVAAMNARVLDKGKALGEILVPQRRRGRRGTALFGRGAGAGEETPRRFPDVLQLCVHLSWRRQIAP